MSARPRTLAGVGLLLTLAAAAPALAQCPDGTPPPCARRNDALPGWRVRAQEVCRNRSLRGFYAGPGCYAGPDSTTNYCVLVAFLPESARVGRIPSDCVAYRLTQRSAGRGPPPSADSVAAVLRRHDFSIGMSYWNDDDTVVAFYRWRATKPRPQERSCGPTMCDTLWLKDSLEVALMAVRQRPATLSIQARSAVVRELLGEAIARSLFSARRQYAGSVARSGLGQD